jgi:hypothetical protein
MDLMLVTGAGASHNLGRPEDPRSLRVPIEELLRR